MVVVVGVVVVDVVVEDVGGAGGTGPPLAEPAGAPRAITATITAAADAAPIHALITAPPSYEMVRENIRRALSLDLRISALGYQRAQSGFADLYVSAFRYLISVTSEPPRQKACKVPSQTHPLAS